ncbi:plantaricin C family lantibiotic [Bacillus sp. RC206]|uniref:plantaricin C family lantibiotic n=1 Tax=Bacillus sp. RC206 TaxID=3156281 RepID=UPI003837A8B2
MKKSLTNPVLQHKYSVREKNPAGDLLQEINEQEMKAAKGGWTPADSMAFARMAGLGNNYGTRCTVSAECMLTISCGS